MKEETNIRSATEPEPTLDQGEFGNITIGDTQLRYFSRTVNSGDPPLLICNGLGQSIEILQPLIDEIPDRSVYVVDMPGTGLSEDCSKIATIPLYAELTADAMERLGVSRYDVLGISWGGCVAQQLAYSYSDQVRRLVLAIASAGGIGSWWGTPLALSEIFFPMRYSSEHYRDFVGPLMYGGEAIFQPEQFRAYSTHAIKPSATGYFNQVRAMCTWTSLPWLQQLKQKSLIIAGNFDTLIPLANQLLLANAIPRSELRVFPAGHLVMYTRRQEIGATVDRFLS